MNEEEEDGMVDSEYGGRWGTSYIDMVAEVFFWGGAVRTARLCYLSRQEPEKKQETLACVHVRHVSKAESIIGIWLQQL